MLISHIPVNDLQNLHSNFTLFERVNLFKQTLDVPCKGGVDAIFIAIYGRDRRRDVGQDVLCAG